MSIQPAEIVVGLKTARGFLQQGWTQHWYARDATGANTGYNSPTAVCWCLRGAILHTTPNWDLSNLMEKVLLREGVVTSLAIWNDASGRTQDEVIALLDKAIAAVSA